MHEWQNKLLEQIPYKTRKGPGGTMLNYITARDVMDRLDTVCGLENWKCDYKEIKGNVYCTISIKFGDEWVSKCDCGSESNIEAEKGESSDAFKRAAVKFGIGRFLYDPKLPKMSSPAQPSTVQAAEDVFEPAVKPVVPGMDNGLDSYGRPIKLEGAICSDCNTGKYVKSPKTNKIFCEDKCWTQ